MFDTLSPKQKMVIEHARSEHTMCLSGGAIRSGKTTAAVLGFAIWVLHEGSKHDHALLGQSIESIMRNMGFMLIDVLQTFGVRAKFTRDLGSRIVVPYKGREINIWVLGANDERAQRRIQGSTLMGVLADETVLWPESFFFVAWGRMSVRGAKFWGTYNPDNPRHWFKTRVVDRVEEFDGYVINFGLDDNPSLSTEVKDRYKSSYIGHWKKRMIDGEWAGASGLIFPEFTVEEGDTNGQISLAIDWGLSSVFAALAFSHHGPKAHCFHELYYDGRVNEPRSESAHLEALNAWASTLGATRCTVYIDPSAPNSFKRLLRKHGYRVRGADNDVLPGLVTTSTRLSQGDITIHPRCTNLIEEAGSYQWDEKKAERGEDAPAKVNDHCCDALRYYAHTTGKAYRHHTPTNVKDIGF